MVKKYLCKIVVNHFRRPGKSSFLLAISGVECHKKIKLKSKNQYHGILLFHPPNCLYNLNFDFNDFLQKLNKARGSSP